MKLNFCLQPTCPSSLTRLCNRLRSSGSAGVVGAEPKWFHKGCLNALRAVKRDQKTRFILVEEGF